MDLKQEFDDTQNNQQEEEQEHFHVLAVDDSLIDRKLLEKLLTVSSYKVTCVDSGDKALEYLGLLENNDSTTTCSSSSSSCSCLPSSSQLQEVHGSKVNLIMTDYSMPGMSGYDLLKRVKGSTWKDVPVVVMSSENVPSRINMCLEGGAKEFLLKPVKLSDLRKLQSYLLNSLTNSCKIIDKEFVDDQNHDNNTINDNDISSSSSSSISNTNDKSSSGTNNANKRKAMSPDGIERRPKMKELVVL